MEDLRAALIAHQAGRAAGWGSGVRVSPESFLATALLRLAEDAEADRWGDARAPRRRAKSKKDVATLMRGAMNALAAEGQRVKVAPPKTKGR